MAIVGMSCRFPGGGNLNEFWQTALAGRPQFAAVPESRWNHSTFLRREDPRHAYGTYTDQVAFLHETERFAPSHYGLPPRRARAMDPQQRLFLDLAREALQDAGWERENAFDRSATGVFAGVSSTDFGVVAATRLSAVRLADGSLHGGQADPELLAGLEAAAASAIMPPGPFSVAGTTANMVPALVSEVLDLGGPSYAVDAACSSSLVALDAAVRSLRSGACSVALVGGVFINSTPNALIGFSRARALSMDGVCRPFDERADGFVLGEGGAVLVLRPVQDAVAAGDRVYAVVSGVGLANDGRGGGPMAPQARGQLAALRTAYRDARVTPGAVDLLEAHGTGTPVGDRTEIAAMRLLREEAGSSRPCYVSSSKALIGHTLSAAGAAGLVRAALALHHGVVPPQPAGHRINCELGLDQAGLRVATSPQPLPDAATHRAGVSSFGFGGTNGHVVLESAPASATPVRARSAPREVPWLFLLSAGSVPQLAGYARQIGKVVARSEAAPAAVARTLATRELLTARLSIVAATREELLERLDLAARRLDEGVTGELASGVHAAAKPLPEEARTIAFAFPGQGSQRPGMLTDLVERFPGLARRAEELTALAGEQSHALATGLAELLWPPSTADTSDTPETSDTSDTSGTSEPADPMVAMTATDVCQPALGVSAVATTELLAACGVVPAVCVGHSVGEFPAAAAAGAIPGAEAVRFMARRGAALAGAVPAGSGTMLAVQVTRDEAQRLADQVPGVWPACYNHERQVVFSGDEAAVERLREHCAERRVATIRLHVSHAFHSPLVSAADDAVADSVAALPLTAPSRALVSSVDGTLCEDPERLRNLWSRHNSVPVRFADAVTATAHTGVRFLVQVYGGDSLLRMARSTAAASGLETIPLTAGRSDGGRAFLTGLGRLAVAGVVVNLAPLFAACDAPLLSLPPTPLHTSVFSVFKEAGRQEGGKPERLACPATTAAASEGPRPTDTAAAPDDFRTPATARVSVAPVSVLSQPQSTAAVAAPAPADRTSESHMSALIAFLHAQVNLLQAYGPPGAGTPPPLLTPPLPGVVPTDRARTRTDVPGTEGSDDAVPVAAAPPSRPGAADRVAPRVLSCIAKVSAYPEDFLQPGHSFVNDLSFDSIMLTELAVEIRRQWPGLEIQAADAMSMETVGELVAKVRELLAFASDGPAPHSGPWDPTAESRNASPAPTPPAPPVSDRTRAETADVTALPEVVASLQRTHMHEPFGVRNPYFLRHEGTIRDVTRVDGDELISFSSYNYLGLSGHPAVNEAVHEAVERYGSSVSAARILSGNRPLHEELDAAIARLIGAEDALTLVSGHATNVSVIGHLMGPEDLILHDALAHDSIIQGCRLSRASRQPFPHNDIGALNDVLGQVRDRYRRVLIVVEGVYSMDGDIIDLPALIAVKQRHAALLMVDEAHSVGVLGKTGGGIAQHWHTDAGDVDIWMGTLSKSLASCGGYVAGRHQLIEHFRYTLPGFVYSAGLTPPNTAAALAALRVIEEEPERVVRLQERAAHFHRLAVAAGVDVGTSEGTPVVPCITGSSEHALKLTDRLLQRGVSVNPILHPAVEEHLTRLRFFVTSEHTEQQIEYAVKVMSEELARPA
ncbi:aminotransferase class I/II-fold pyridoxal phosphate-dependent enzyme [Streptomyces anthocyanicus]|uniref:aminotransferase class I/II-fold pyridoxal phosphate-dependent enzyme n=1 Tax=Streptomyces anthocyanicus TaxID=68174 RepID=UPI002F910674